MTDVRVCLVTAPDEATALGLARRLVEEKLCACANLVSGVRSIYRWQGRVEDEAEALLIIKTTAGSVDKLTDRIVELHPYDLPEVIALPVVAGLAGYLDWVTKETA